MRQRKYSRFLSGLVALSCFLPANLSAQQLPPSVLLEANMNPQGQVVVVVRTLSSNPPAPNAGDLSAFLSGKLLIPWLISLLQPRGRPVMVPEELYDSQEFPNGPTGVRLTFRPICVPARAAASGVFTPGFVGFIVPLRLSQMLTPELFLQMFLANYVIEINGVKFMDSSLLTPEHVTRTGEIRHPLVRQLLGPVEFWGLNITLKLTQPGTYVIRNYIRVPKSIPLPELTVIFRNGVLPAGELIAEMTVTIQSSC